MKYNAFTKFMATNKKGLPKLKPEEIITSPDKSVPKFCTGISFAVMNNKYVIINLLFNEPNNKPVLIDRVLVDIDHAQKVADVLNNLLSSVKKNATNNNTANNDK